MASQGDFEFYSIGSNVHPGHYLISRSLLLAWAIALLPAFASNATAALPGGIKVSAKLTPERVHPGETAELSIRIHLPLGWICYDLEQVPNSVLPTTIKIDPIDDIAVTETFRSEGAKEGIESKFQNRIVRFFDLTPTFTRPVWISDRARLGEHAITGRIAFLAQHLATKRFYVVSNAHFSAPLLVELPNPSATTDERPENAGGELSPNAAEIEALLAADLTPPKPPAPPFEIHIEAPAAPPPEEGYSDEFLLVWSMGILAVVALAGWRLTWPPPLDLTTAPLVKSEPASVPSGEHA